MEKPCSRGNFLTEEERVAFRDFLQLSQEKGLRDRPSDLQDLDVVHGLNDEATLLRFLQGRSFDADGALRQHEEAQTIRQSADAITTYETIDLNTFEATRRMYPHWTGRRTKEGLPICIFDVSCLDSATMSGFAKDRSSTDSKGGSSASVATKRAIAYHDYITRFVLPLCTAARDRPNQQKPVTSAVYLLDAGSLTLRQGWDIRSYAQETSKLLATCYPEVIERAYILNASYYFAKVWDFLSRWIDPRTAAKLVIVPPGETNSILGSQIEHDSIPGKYGGGCSHQLGAPPKLDSGLLGSLDGWCQTSDSLPTGPIKWISDNAGRRAAVAVGSDSGKRREAVIARVDAGEESLLAGLGDMPSGMSS